MNFYNPYYYTFPSTLTQPKIGLLGRLFGSTGISISNFLNGTQKVLNIANQTIPLVKQVKPMIGNAKTMFRVMNEFKKADKPNKIEKKEIINNETTETNTTDNLGPKFFI